jgi:hypothetical protein
MEIYNFEKVVLEKNEDGTYKFYGESLIFDSMDSKMGASEMSSNRCIPKISLDLLIDKDGSMMSIRN